MSWQVHNFEDVVFLQEGPGIRKYEYEEGGYPMINVRCVQDGYVDMSKSRSANRELAEGKWKHFQIDAGDILFTISGTIGRAAIVKPSDLPLLMNTSVVRFKSKVPALSPSFLYHYVRSSYFVLRLQGMATGTAIKNVGPSHLKKMSVPIPPLEEQERIVEVLDEAFTAIDKAKANIERNLTNARELFQSRLNDVFSNPSEDWEVKPLGEISAIRYGHTDKSNVDFRGPKFLRITDIQDGVVNWESVPRCNPMTEQDWAKYELRKGDIVFARTGATTGKSFLLSDVEDAVFASYLIRVRLHQLDAAPFVALFFESPEYWAVVAEGTTGSAQGGFNAKKLSSLSIPLPPREVQAEVIMELSELRRNVRNLEDGYQAELNSLDELRQSILEQAFEGKLTEPVAA